MKEITTVNIGKSAFTIEKDACHMLQRYLDDIAQRCDDATRNELIEDVEMRLAEIFSQQLATPYNVVDSVMVREAISTIGPAESFGDLSERRTAGAFLNRRLTRSHNRVIGGVCGGVADYFGVDATPVRLLIFVLMFFGGFGLLTYIIMWIVMPPAPKEHKWRDGESAGRESSMRTEKRDGQSV